MKKFLFCHPGALGDFILTWPIIKTLRKSLPGYRLVAIGRKEYCDLASRLGLLDEYHDINARYLTDFFSGKAISPGLGNPEGAIIWMTDAEKTRVLLDKICHLPVVVLSPFPEDTSHLTDQYFRKIQKYYTISRPTKYLSFSSISSTKSGPVFIHPGSGDVKKNYSVSFYKNISRELITAGYHDVRIILGPVEKERGFRACFSDSVIVQPDNVTDLATLLKQGKLYIGNDSGVSHLSGILGIPTIALYKRTDPRIWGVLGSWVINLQATNEAKARKKIEIVLRALKSEGIDLKSAIKKISQWADNL